MSSVHKLYCPCNEFVNSQCHSNVGDNPKILLFKICFEEHKYQFEDVQGYKKCIAISLQPIHHPLKDTFKLRSEQKDRI